MPTLLSKIFGFTARAARAATATAAPRPSTPWAANPYVAKRPGKPPRLAVSPNVGSYTIPESLEDAAFAPQSGGFRIDDPSTWTFPHRGVWSSNLQSVAYDFPNQVMEVRFQPGPDGNSSVYRYSEVPLAVYRGLMDAPSKGKFHHAYIKDRYVYVRMS